MNYDQFRTAWHEALVKARLAPFPPWPAETIDLGQFSRTYKITVNLGPTRQTAPFYVSATLSWRWDAALAARSATTEEDLLTELLGQDGYDQDTEQPWLRVDVSLNATLPLDSSLPMPEATAWRRWSVEVTTRLASILPVDNEVDEDEELVVLSWRDEPAARLRCDPDGRLYLTRVELSAWQGINLPRQWDNPERLSDPEPEAQLLHFASRVRRALQVWEGCLKYLQ